MGKFLKILEGMQNAHLASTNARKNTSSPSKETSKQTSKLDLCDHIIIVDTVGNVPTLPPRRFCVPWLDPEGDHVEKPTSGLFNHHAGNCCPCASTPSMAALRVTTWR